MCTKCRTPFITKEHLIECYFCDLKKDKIFKCCRICVNFFEQNEMCRPSCCDMHFYCLICVNSRGNNIFHYYDSDSKKVFFQGEDCQRCENFFKSYIIEPRPPNCFMCGLFANQISCFIHNYCKVCLNYLKSLEKRSLFDKVANCRDCTSFFQQSKERRELETYPGNSGSNNILVSNQIVENPIDLSHKDSISSSKSNEINPFSLSEECKSPTSPHENLKPDQIPRMSIINNQDLNLKPTHLKSSSQIIENPIIPSKNPNHNCFCCTKNKAILTNPSCNHLICEFCLFYYIYKPVLFNLIQTAIDRRLPESKLNFKCKCKKDFTLIYPLSKFLTYVESIVKNHSERSLGNFYQDFQHISHYSSFLKNFENYLEGFEVEFCFCPSCRYLCFKQASKVFCPWCQKFFN
jgi:hypothetical protein